MASWVEGTHRWGQVNVGERDPVDLDVERWAAYWKECELQAVTLNAGGALAYYPTDVPDHPRSPWLGDGDLFGATVGRAKAMGLRVLGRLDVSVIPASAHATNVDEVRSAAGLLARAPAEGPHPHSYLAVEAHPLLEGAEGTSVLPGARYLAAPVLDAGVLAAGAWIADFPTMPTHAIRMPEPDPHTPTLAVRGRDVLLGMDFDSSFGEFHHPDHSLLLLNAVRHALAEPLALVVEGEGLLDVRPWRQARSETVWLVNLHQPELYGGPVVKHHALGPQRILERPEHPVARARLLRTGAELPLIERDGRLVVTVPGIEDFEVLALDYA